MEIKIRQGVASDAAQTTPLILNAAQSLLTSIFGQNKTGRLIKIAYVTLISLFFFIISLVLRK